MSSYRFFIAGIMQGSLRDLSLHSQGYRAELASLIERHFEGAQVYDPFSHHDGSLNYDDETGRRTFYRHNLMCRNETDVLIAFVPEASMGTAIEMWEAYQSGAAVFVISPLKKNWSVKYLCHAVYASLEEFESAITDGTIAEAIEMLLESRTNPTLDYI